MENMLSVEQEGRWLIGLPHEKKLLFLAELGHELTIVGRHSYEPGTEALEKPGLLRRVNEVQHRVLACLVQLQRGCATSAFQEAVPAFLTEQTDTESRELMGVAWCRAKERALGLERQVR